MRNNDNKAAPSSGWYGQWTSQAVYMAQGVMATGRNGPFLCGFSPAQMDAIAFLRLGAV